MANFVRLTTIEGLPILINLDLIVSILSDKESGGTRLWEGGETPEPFIVQESFEDVARLESLTNVKA